MRKVRQATYIQKNIKEIYKLRSIQDENLEDEVQQDIMYEQSQQMIQEASQEASSEQQAQSSSNRSFDMQGITPIPQNYYMDDLKDCLKLISGRKTSDTVRNFIENPKIHTSYFRTIFLAHFLQSYLILQQNKLQILKFLGVDTMQSNQFVSGTGDNSGLMPTTLNTVLNSQIRYLPNCKYLFYSGLTFSASKSQKDTSFRS